MSEEAVNTHDQLVKAGGGIAIGTATLPGRSRRAYGWDVYRVVVKDGKAISVVTDSDAPWYAYGRKVFRFEDQSAEGKAAALKAAQDWVADTYGEQGPWKRNGMRQRQYVPERINKQFPLRKL